MDVDGDVPWISHMATPEEIKRFQENEKEENINEIILAIPSNMEGELTSLYIKKILANDDIKIYQIGYGLPAELSVEYADEITLIKSLESKKQI